MDRDTGPATSHYEAIYHSAQAALNSYGPSIDAVGGWLSLRYGDIFQVKLNCNKALAQD